MRAYRVLIPMDCVQPRTGVDAQITLHRLGQSSYPYNVTPLVGADAIRFGRHETTSVASVRRLATDQA